MKLAMRGITLEGFVPLVDGQASPEARIETREIEGGVELVVVLPRGGQIDSIGVRFAAAGVRQYLRNGYTSWDGSFFVEPGAAAEAAQSDPNLTRGYAMTALLPRQDGGAVVVGFLRHDRYQSRLSFTLGEPLSIALETLIDEVPHAGEVRSEAIVILEGAAVEPVLRGWAMLVAAASPLSPRVPARRATGWCSWYNLYAALSEPVLLEHLAAARRFRDQYRAPFDVFLVDDGFTPEMGDWLEVKPQFPRGIRPVLEAAREAGFTPGLWIAPFMVGNRSRLFAEHPDWVVRARTDGRPLAPMKFYGEFRWHKRSEEYYVLDVTHPQAAAYIREVFRTWRREWGVGYFKTDFMHLGSLYGPREAVWHQPGLSRIAIWMRMARLIREEIGDAFWLGCGSPIFAPVGLVDAMRIGRDIGVSWTGHYSAQSLLRDQTARNFANGILWQADPDCILLRDRFHDLDDEQVRSLAIFAGLAGGVLMTSDHLDEVPPTRRALLEELAGDGSAFRCDFPELGQTALRYRLGVAPDGRPLAIAEGDPVLVQRVVRGDGSALLNFFNTSGEPIERVVDPAIAGVPANRVAEDGTAVAIGASGLMVRLGPYQSRQFLFSS